MVRLKEKLDTNVQVNFNKSKEISYWAKKLNMDSTELKKKFEELDSSISKTIAYYQNISDRIVYKQV